MKVCQSPVLRLRLPLGRRTGEGVNSTPNRHSWAGVRFLYTLGRRYQAGKRRNRPLCEVGNYVKLEDQLRHFKPSKSGHSAHSCRASKTSQSRQVVSSRRRSRRARRAARSAVPSWPSAAQRNDAGGSWFRDPCAAGSASSSISLRRSFLGRVHVGLLKYHSALRKAEKLCRVSLPPHAHGPAVQPASGAWRSPPSHSRGLNIGVAM
jgi:hypothetical protein